MWVLLQMCGNRLDVCVVTQRRGDRCVCCYRKELGYICLLLQGGGGGLCMLLHKGVGLDVCVVTGRRGVDMCVV